MSNAVDQHALRPLVAGRSAWIGADLAKRPDEWTYRLSPHEIAEIETATAGVLGRDIATIARADFPLPALGPTLDRLRDDVLSGRGFVLIRGLPVTGRPIDESATAYWGIGYVFSATPDRRMRKATCSAMSATSACHPRIRTSVSTRPPSGRISIPTLCDIVSLLCLKTAKSGGLSSLTSSMSVYNAMAQRHPDLVWRLFQPMPTDRRGEVPEGRRPWFETPIYNDHLGLLSAIYAPHYVRSSQRFPDAPRLSAADIAALDCFDALAEDAELRLDMEFQPGDMQFVHNHTVLHDRTAFEDWPEPERKRHLLRLWLAAPGARPLPAAYAERYGSVEIGNRGGIVCKGTKLHAPLEAV